MFDIIIKNGTIIDGTGGKKIKSDVGIKHGKIKEIGDLSGAKSLQVIDVDGLYVAPGFIDIQNHSDSYYTLFTQPNLESLVNQGITTIIGGNCGSSLAPLMEGKTIESIQKWANIKNVNVNWLYMKEFLEELERKRIPVNFGTLVGHATLRRGLIQDEVRRVTLEELRIMEGSLRLSLEQGAFGMSTGLAYTHAKLASAHEIIRLLKTVKDYSGIHALHLRDEKDSLVPAFEEAVYIARQSGVPLRISHLKAMGDKNWRAMSKILEDIVLLNEDGVRIYFDMYPYQSVASVLYIFLPDWVVKGGKKEMLKRLANKEIAASVMEEMKKQMLDYDKIIIANSMADRSFIGKSIKELAQNQGVSEAEAVINILLAAQGQVIVFIDNLSEDNLMEAMKSEFSVFGSDSAGYSTDYFKNGELVHPRSFGSFPRILGLYVREKKVLSWEKAIYKMTGLPAELLSISDRGTLKRGNMADITIFNPKTIMDKAIYTNPFQHSVGIEYVLVNGEIVIDQGIENQVMAGRVLRRS